MKTDLPYYAVSLAFYPNQTNPLRPSGRGVWRVKAVSGRIPPYLVERPGLTVFPGLVTGKGARLVLFTHRPVKARSRVNPRALVGV